jgi:lipopolysaccharide transport system ATP-binding protein
MQNAITVEGLGKRYSVGSAIDTPDTLVGWLQSTIRAPLRNYRYIRGLTRHQKAVQPENDDAHSFWALRDVCFRINTGEVVGIVGRNGAGKSTLLKVLSRITEPTTGRAEIRGRVSSLLEVGTGFHPELTGRENVYMNGTVLGMTKREIDRKFDQIVEFAGVERFLDTPIKRYSSGMQVRLAFSVAAHLDPEILIIDEVLAVGDAEFQKRCIGKMQEVAGGGRTVLFVSHNLSAVGQLCNSGLLMSGGKVAARGALEDVVKAYMADLFKTQSTVGNDQVTINVELSIDGHVGGRVWKFGSKLTVRVQVKSQQTMRQPALDLYFYSSAGRMIYAQSDRFVQGGKGDADEWIFNFHFVNNGFVSDYMTIDIGFRFSCNTRYLGLWRSVAAVALGTVPPGYTHGKECPVCVPCDVEIRDVAA